MGATDLLTTQQICCLIGRLDDEPGIQAMANQAGCTFEPGRGGHQTVRLGNKVTTLPMHGKGKELGTGLVRAIKKQLGLR